MRSKIMVKSIIVAGVVLLHFLLMCNIAIPAEKIKLTYWSVWGHFLPDYVQWYEKGGEMFSKIHPEVDLAVEPMFIPYDGYTAKYLSAFTGISGAPDMFQSMAHQEAGKYSFVDPMPGDLAQYIDDNVIPNLAQAGVWEGKRYGIPIENATQMLHINVDMFKEAGLDPNREIETYDQFLEYAKKLTKDTDGDGELDQWGYAIRYTGNPLGIADKFISPFLHAWGAEMINVEQKKASGYVNSKEAIDALRFYGDLVNKYHVTSLELPGPTDAFGRKLVAMVTEDLFVSAWLAKNAPDIDYKVYCLPKGKVAPGGTTSVFAWADMVYKHASSENKAWAWEFLSFITSPPIYLDHCSVEKFFAPVFKFAMHADRAKTQPYYEALMKMEKRPSPPVYFIPEAQELAYELGEAVVKVLYNKASPEEALNTAAVNMDKILKE